MGNSDIKELVGKIEKLSDDKGRKELMESCCKKVAMHFLDIAEDYTPIDSGRLVHGWIGEKDGKGELNGSEINNYVSAMPIHSGGSNYNITISNAVHYAPYINYGHRTRLGKKNKSVQRWVEGFYMLEESTKLTKMDIPVLLGKEAKAYFEKALK